MKKLFFKYLTGFSLFSVALIPAQAQVDTGDVLNEGQLLSGTQLTTTGVTSEDVLVYQESSEVLSSKLSVNDVPPGFDSSGKISAGTQITDFLIYFNYPGTKKSTGVSGTVTFGSDIIGLITSTDDLNDSDAALGVDGVNYTQSSRGLESKDDWSVSGNQLTFNIDDWVTSGAVDEVRVILAGTSAQALAVPDGGSTLALLGLAVSLLGLGRKLSLRKR
jgi:hypothetical protein